MFSLPRSIVLLGLVSFFTDISSEMIFPLLPIFLVSVLGASPAVFGLIDGLAESAAAVLKWVSGWLADRSSKRKPLVLLGYTLSTLMRPLVGLAGSWPLVLILRVLDRVGKGLRTSPRDALIADITKDSERGKAYGLHRAMDHAGAVVGPLAAWALMALFSFELRQVFLWAFVPGIAAIVILIFFVREPKPLAKQDPLVSKASSNPFKDFHKMGTRYKKMLLAFFVFSLSQSTDVFLLLKLREVGVADSTIPLLWALLHVVKVASTYLLGSLSDRFGYLKMISAGWIYYGLIYLAIAFVTDPLWLIALFLFYGLYFGLTEGPERAWISRTVPTEVRGSALGLFHMVVGLSLFPANALFGWVWTAFGSKAAFLMAVAFAVVALALHTRATSAKEPSY